MFKRHLCAHRRPPLAFWLVIAIALVTALSDAKANTLPRSSHLQATETK